MMDTLIQVLVGISAIFLSGLGARTMFAPRSVIELLAIQPDGAAGLNTMRGFLGGLFFGSAILLVIGLVSGATVFFVAVATTMGMVVLGRLLGILIDGFDKRIVVPLVAEIVMVTIFLVGIFS